MLYSNVVVSLLKNVGLMILLFLTAAKGVGQTIDIINQPRKMAPFVVVIYDKKKSDFAKTHLKDYKDSKGTSLLLIEANDQAAGDLKNLINNRLNYTPGVDLQRCYLLIIGDKSIFDRYQSIGNALLFSTKYYLTNEPSNVSADFLVGDLSSTTIREVIEKLSEKYLWQVRLEEIEDQNVSDLNQNAIESGIGLRVSGVKPFYNGIETSIKPFFRTFSFNIYHRWGRRWQTNLDVTVGLNMPSQRSIQREIESVGFSEDEVDITIHAHILTSAGLETRYLFLPENRKLNPYVGIRLGASAISATENTIEVDPDDVSSGNFERPDGFHSDDFESIRSPTIGVSSGLQYNMSHWLMVEAGMQWSNDLKNITEVAEPYFNNLSFSVGFNFRFTGKKKLFYNYINSNGSD